MKNSTNTGSGKLRQFPAALFNRRAAAMLATGALLLTAHPASADIIDWNSSVTAPFSTAADWTAETGGAHVVPTTGNIANIINGGTATIGTGDSFTVDEIWAGNGGNGNNGSGNAVQSGGLLTVNNWFVVGRGGQTGTYTFSGGTITKNGGGNSIIGDGGGNGTLTISGASTVFNAAGEFWVGNGVGSTGLMNMSGGAVTVSNFLAIGRQSSTGTLNQSGGTITKTGNGNIEIGTYNANTGSGVGFYNLSGTGVVNLNSGADLIGSGGGTGTLTISGGTFNMNGAYTSIGASGTGTLNITSGSYIDGGAQDFNVADNGGTHGTLNVSGTGVLNTATGNFFVGKNGTGVVNLGSGVAGGLITTKGVIGSGGGTFNFNGGTLQANAANPTFIAGLAAANVQAGGAVIDTNGNTDTIGEALLHSGTGTDGGLTLNDSTAAPGGTLILTGANTYTGATTITNGTLQLGDGTTDGSISSTSGVTDNSALVYELLANRTLGYGISGTGSVTLNDTGTTTGTLTLTKANTYTGATNLTTGNLTLDHTGTNTGSLGNTAVNVNTNTLLVKGSTTIGSPGTGSVNVATSGTLSLQDNTLNTLGIGGTLTLTNASLNLDLGSANGSSDKINVGGAASISNSVINLDALGSIVSGTSTYTLLTAASGLGTGFMLGTEPAGFITYSLASSTPTAEILSITANPTVVGAEYFTGAASRTLGDTANNLGDSANGAMQSNFSTNRAGTIDPKQVPGATTDLIFTANNATPATGTNTLTATLDGAYQVHSLTFDVPASTGITSTTLNTNSSTLTLGAGGLAVAATSASSGTISGGGSVVLNGSQSFADNSALGLTVSTPIVGNAGSGTNTLTFAGTGSGPVMLTGPISDGILGGNLGLVVSKTGGGVLTLSGANTYTGGTTFNSGQVILGSPTALGAATNTLTFGAGSTSDLQLAGNSITVGGLNTNGTTVGTPVIENASATPATLTDNATTASRFGGVLQDGTGGGPLSLTETGSGIQTLTGANTYTGGTTVNAPGGGLALGAGGTLGAATNTTTVSAGTLDLGGQSVTQNELILNGGNVVGPTSTLTLTATSSTAVLINSGAYTFAAPADTATLALNGGNIVKSLGGTTGNNGNGNANIAGNITLGSAGTTVALQDSPGDLFPELTLSGVISGPGALTQDNTANGTSTQEYGTLLLSGANTYTGGTNINFGRTEIANSTALGTGPVTVGSNGTLALGGGFAQNVNGGNLTVANAITLNHTVAGNYNVDALQNNFGANTLTGPITLAAPASAFAINGGSLNATGVISGAGALSKYGGAPLTLSGANTYSGATNIYLGTLSVPDIENGGVTSSIGTSSNAPANLEFYGGTLQYTGLGVTTDRGYTVNGNSVLDTGANNLTFTGQILATGGSFTKIGAGTVTYINTATPNTYDGNTGYPGFLVNQGKAVFGAPGATASGQVNNVKGELDIAGTGAVGNTALDINSGTTNITAYLAAGRGSSTTGATAVVTLNNDAVVNSANASLGYDNGLAGYTAAPTLNLNNTSSYTDAGVFRVGESNGSTATVNVNNTSSFTDNGAVGNALFVGDGGIGIVNQNNNSTVTAANPIVLGNRATGNGTYNLNGGTLTTPGLAQGLGTGTFNFNGGTLQDTAANTTANNAAFLQGLTTANVRNGGAVIDTNGNTVTVGQPLLHSSIVGDNAADGGLTVKSTTAGGTLILTGANTYTGATTITGGTLQIGNGTTGSIAATSAVNVGGGTTLTVDNNGALNNAATAVTLGSGGTGGTLQNGLAGTAAPDGTGNSITNNVQQAGTLSLGTGTTDILNFAGNTGTFDFAGAGPSFAPGQRLDITGFGAGTNEMLNGATPGTEVGNYQLLFNNGLTPTQLADITFLNSDSTQFGATQQQISTGVNMGKFQVLESAVAAPEPAQTAALGLFGLGLGALILKARKRRGMSA